MSSKYESTRFAAADFAETKDLHFCKLKKSSKNIHFAEQLVPASLAKRPKR